MIYGMKEKKEKLFFQRIEFRVRLKKKKSKIGETRASEI